MTGDSSRLRAMLSADLPGGPTAHAFFLDMDGTLLDIAEAPDLVQADPQLLVTISTLYRATGGAIAVISGRTVAGIDRLLAPLRLPAAGQHGVERRDAAGNTYRHAHSVAQLDELRRCVQQWAAGVDGLLIEDKGMSLAVHYRQMPQLAEQVRQALQECLGRIGDDFGLQPGRMVVDVKPNGRDKGTAILEFMGEPPFAGRIPVFIGDDVTDEHGFAAVSRLGGRTIKVGPGPTIADRRLPDVAGVRLWLESILGGSAP